MKNKLITLNIALLLLSMQQLSAQNDTNIIDKKNEPIITYCSVKPKKPDKLMQINISDSQNIRICSPSRIGLISSSPLYVLKNNNRVIDTSMLQNVNPKSIENIEIPYDASTVKKYGPKGANGVIIITLKEDSVLLSVEKIVSVYNLPKKSAKYPVYIDDKYCAKDAIMLEQSKIKTVKVITRLMSGINEKQLEITTVDKQTTPL